MSVYESLGQYRRDCAEIERLKAEDSVSDAYAKAKEIWPRVMATASARRDDWPEIAMHLITSPGGNWILEAVHTPATSLSGMPKKKKRAPDGRYAAKRT